MHEPFSMGRGGEPRPKKAATPAALLRQALGELADVREPGDAEEPILAASVRGALFEWLTEIRIASELRDVGLKPRGTALLYGPPGCGKTTLAHHMAARLGLPLVVVGPETLFGQYFGEAEKNVAGLFERLTRSETPCVLLIDEIEAIGGNRAMNRGGGADNARTSTLTVLLRRIEEYSGYALAATNRPDDLDPALWRRFHLQIPIELPGDDERFAILRRYSLPFALSDDDLDLLTDLTVGASPALLRGLMEGMKRSLVIGARINKPATDPVALFSRIVSHVRPPPEMPTPDLWQSEKMLGRLAELAWPPGRT